MKKPSKAEREQEESRRHYDARQKLVLIASDWANDFCQISTVEEIEAEIVNMKRLLDEIRSAKP
jgi:hypothetical protein